MEFIGSDEVAARFIELCTKLRDLGATRVSAFGLHAHFGSPKPAPVLPTKEEKPQQSGPLLATEEGRSQYAAALDIARAVGGA